MNNISLTSETVTVITACDSSKESGLDNNPVAFLKYCESGLSYISSDLFNVYLTGPCYQDRLKVASVIQVFKNAGESYVVQNCHPRSLISVSTIFEKRWK